MNLYVVLFLLGNCCFLFHFLFVLTDYLKTKTKVIIRHRISPPKVKYVNQICKGNIKPAPRTGETFEKLFFIDPKSDENECKSITGWRTLEEIKH